MEDLARKIKKLNISLEWRGQGAVVLAGHPHAGLAQAEVVNRSADVVCGLGHRGWLHGGLQLVLLNHHAHQDTVRRDIVHGSALLHDLLLTWDHTVRLVQRLHHHGGLSPHAHG